MASTTGTEQVLPCRSYQVPPFLHLKYSTVCPCHTCQQAATQEIIHIACLLNRRLPADVIPTILGYAEIEQTSLINKVYNNKPHGRINTPYLQQGYMIPNHIPQGSISRVSFHTMSSKLQPTQILTQNVSTPDEEESWIEAVVIGLDREKGRGQGGHSLKAQQALSDTALQSSTINYGSKRLVTYRNSDRLDREKFETHWRRESEDKDVRRILKELRGGFIIDIRVFTKLGPDELVVTTAIVIEYAVVTKM